MAGILAGHRSLFIAGTDTGVGKSYFACRLIEELSLRGEKVGVFKPIETGIVSEVTSDAALLKKAAHSNLPISLISPYRFKTVAAPRVASLKERKKIVLRKIINSFRVISQDHTRSIVEGAGGLMVPIQKEFDMAHLILTLNLPLILISRQRIGTINQTLLSLHYAKQLKLKVLAVILNQAEDLSDNSPLHANRRMIEEKCEIPVLTYREKRPETETRRFWKQLLG
jgi:dethiobiotin synthetase